jgi:hypothetical protein
MGRKDGKRCIGIRDPQKCARDGINKGMGDEGSKHGTCKGQRAENGEEDNLEPQENASEGIGMHAGDEPADGAQNYPNTHTNQDLKHEL